MNSIQKLVNKQKGFLMKKQNLFNDKFNIDCTANYYIDKNGKIYCYNDKKIFFIGKYEVIGTYNEKTCYWRWAWSNPNLPNSVTNYSKKMIKFGEEKKLPIFINPRHKGKSDAFNMLVMSNYINSDAQGYLVFKKPRTTLVVYLLIKSAKRSNINHKKFLEKVIFENK